MESRLSPIMPPPDAFSPRSDAFLLDVDGTIIDIAPTPEAVHVPETLKQTLGRLQEETRGATALVSGRKVAALDSLFAPLSLSAVGCHGAEWRVQPGRPIEVRSPPLTQDVKQAFLAAVTPVTGIRIEDKAYTLAFHYRSAPELGPMLERRLEQALVPYKSDLRLLRGKLVLELKPKNFDKGEVILDLMQQAPFAGRRPVFLGDDTTDEDAFRAVRGLGGIGISVGLPMQDAAYMLPDPQAARDWLGVVASAIT